MSDYHPKTVGVFRQAIRDTRAVYAYCPVFADYVRVTKAASLGLLSASNARKRSTSTPRSPTTPGDLPLHARGRPPWLTPGAARTA